MSLRELRVFHAATFGHNIGDGALVAGLHATLAEDLDVTLRVTEDDVLEHKLAGRTRALTPERIDRIDATHDLVLIGGGGLMEGGPENRLNGLNYGFDPSCLERFTIPVVFYAMGFNQFRGERFHHLDRLRETLAVARQTSALVSVRNDHSKRRLEAALGPCPHVHVIPDPGLWVPTAGVRPLQLQHDALNIVLQLAGDRRGARFPGRDRWLAFHRATRRRFTWLGRLARALADLAARRPLNLILCPHVPADHALVGQFLDACPAPLARRHTTSVGMMKGVAQAPAFFDLYRGADAVVGMRGHSAICAVGAGTPFVGIGSHDKVRGFLDEIGLADRVVEMAAGPDRVVQRLEALLEDLDGERRRLVAVRGRLRQVTAAFHARIGARIGASSELCV
ncbi:MAG: polysaccharide pyruvyl transferase family protein [Planctomycetes bacterium]|nr:polysaccharide pyruvyl transferase family protein [Planctomycetota bacterium]